MTKPLTVHVLAGVQLVVYPPRTAAPAEGQVDASLIHGVYPGGTRIAFFCCQIDQVRAWLTPSQGGVWFGQAQVTLSFAALLQVAYFLKLEIPMPESGEPHA
jgi:hypothetical protein